ncbi:hypothetical protein CDD80_1455 [Ophiocordyceps camponoti-rufipedis]|uniref:Uncharacterized protein n=1 Tax=Ophiocordyceps camponoti-rufipedis TaxID=2004952 RepID=A0A2C5X8P9_9HYPO|nr:hypothetical protein CDD80_1455 [Ophiocordyceps camponoti-rufipedis]
MARSPANIRLRSAAIRTFCGAVFTLVSSIVSLLRLRPPLDNIKRQIHNLEQHLIPQRRPNPLPPALHDARQRSLVSALAASAAAAIPRVIGVVGARSGGDDDDSAREQAVAS